MKKRLLHPREDDIQRVIVDGLRLLGCVVLVTTHRVKRCRCGAWSRGDYGATPGVPDLLVRKDGWPAACWLGLEVKGPRTALSRQQKLLRDRGGIIVVRSLEDALGALEGMP